MKRNRLIENASWRVDGIGALVCIAMAGFTYLLGIHPLVEQHAHFVAQQAQLAAQRTAAVSSAASLLNARKIQTEVHGWLAAHPLQLQPAQHTNQRLAQLSNLSNTVGAKLDELKPGSTTPGARYDMLAIHITGTSTYATFATLIHRIRTTFPDMRVSAMDFVGQPSESDVAGKFRLDLQWYTIPASRITAALDTK